MEAGRHELGGGAEADKDSYHRTVSLLGLHGEDLEDYLATVRGTGEEPAPSEPQEEAGAEGGQPDVS